MTTMFRRQSARRQYRGHFIAERRRSWVLPVIAALLAVFLVWRDGRAEIIPIRYTSGKLCLVDTKLKYPIVEFSVCYTVERR